MMAVEFSPALIRVFFCLSRIFSRKAIACLIRFRSSFVSTEARRSPLTCAYPRRQKAVIQRQIDTTDAALARLVYELYGMTAEEIAMLEQTK